MYVSFTTFTNHHLSHASQAKPFPGLLRISRHRPKSHAVSFLRLSVSLSFALRDRFSGYTPRARPRALTGLRLPAVWCHSTCFPTGVTTGARNLCVLVVCVRLCCSFTSFTSSSPLCRVVFLIFRLSICLCYFLSILLSFTPPFYVFSQPISSPKPTTIQTPMIRLHSVHQDAQPHRKLPLVTRTAGSCSIGRNTIACT